MPIVEDRGCWSAYVTAEDVDPALVERLGRTAGRVEFWYLLRSESHPSGWAVHPRLAWPFRTAGEAGAALAAYQAWVRGRKADGPWR